MSKWSIAVSISLSLLSSSVYGDGHEWKKNQIEDALMAAPPVITKKATIYGWDETKGGEMTLLRSGTGEYTCLATGFSSLRVGKPLEPIPGPLCADANAWAFLEAVMKEDNAMKPKKPYPTTPGMVWMLAGMGIKEGMVDVGLGDKIEVVQAGKGSGSKMTKITPHIMVMPLPMEKDGSMSTKYSPTHPLAPWIMAAGTPFEHLMLHVSDEDAAAIMQGKID